MKLLEVNKDLGLGMVFVTIFDALKAIGVDTSDLTIDELVTIKRGLLKGMEEVNSERGLIKNKGNEED